MLEAPIRKGALIAPGMAQHFKVFVDRARQIRRPSANLIAFGDIA